MTRLLERFDNIRTGEPLAQYTTLRIGGPAKYFLIVKTREDLRDALQIAKSESIPVFLLGGGSNVLIDSAGFNGLVIKNEMRHLQVDGSSITAESGVILASVIKLAKEHGLTGIADLQGVPGTFGAAVRGNVGVPTCEMGTFVKSAVLLTEDLEWKVVDRGYFCYGYRYSTLKKNHEIVIEATIELNPGGNPVEISQRMMSQLAGRKAKQPWGQSGGSYFKNPSKEYSAGFLVDQVGGKGEAVGEAYISEKHANFFMNKGQATSGDVQELASIIKTRVDEKFGIHLEEEVEFISTEDK